MPAAIRTHAAVERLDVAAYTIPTDEPESDGTAEWTSTTIVVVEAPRGGETGLGYTYCVEAAAAVVDGQLRDVVEGMDALAPQGAARAMGATLRNAGRPGIGFCALSAVDIALWDLKARASSASRSPTSSAAHTTTCRSTAPAASAPIHSSGSPSSSAAGPRRASRG